MIVCKNCGVELDDDVQHCPLCGELVAGDGSIVSSPQSHQWPLPYPGEMTPPQKKLTWEIVSVVLLSVIMATLLIDYILNRQVTWSEYPVAVSLTAFAYVSLFAFSRQRIGVRMAGGFLLGSIFMIVLDALTAGVGWSTGLGVPLLLAANVVTGVLILSIRKSKYRGLNLVAYFVVAAAMLTVFLEGILSRFRSGTFEVDWSVIVAGCAMPVVLVLLFLHFRLKKGSHLERTFHV